MTAPRAYLFGTPALAAGAQRAPLPPERPYQLLAYLALRATWVTRDAAAALLWPERDTATARANLRFVLVQIRRLTHIAGFEARADALRWAVDTDVRRLEAAVAAADWDTALASYAGPLLDGFEAEAPAPFVEWLRFERARLAALWHDALTARLAQLRDDPAACGALARRALATDPLDETALTAYLQALCAQARADEARRAYRDYAQRLATDLGIEPSAALRDLARQLHTGGIEHRRATAPAKRDAASGFVGRRVELGRLRAWLGDDESRALVIVGPGGVGKSALARAALAALADALPEGAFWIALDDLRAIEALAPRCATALDFELRGAKPPGQQLHEHLRTARSLLVFDNAEHIPGIDEWLGALLAACPSLKVVVTSRVRLELPSAQLLPLAGLPVPDPEESEVDAIRAYDAVRLFEARALREHPDFDGAAAAPDVAALVRIVDGLPLAIELAAAWVRMLPVAEIGRELEHSPDLLDRGEAGSRHGYSIRGSFEHSWRLLAPAEQRALARLAVFHGSFSRQSARAVADAALPLLAALADKSLLRATDGGRFAFHPLLRQFALAKLAEIGADEQRAAHERHAAHFLAMLARFEAFHALDQAAALKAIGAEIENTLAAWRWAIGQRRVDLFEHSASALESYLDARGQHQLGLELLTQAAAVIDEALPAHQLACCHVQLSRAAFCYRRGEFAEGERAARAALKAAHRIKYRFGIQSCTNTLGLTLWRLGRLKEATFCLRDVLRRARADGDTAWIPLYAVNLCRLEFDQGNDEEGERLLHEALDGNRRNANVEGILAALNELCQVQIDQAKPQAVLPLAREGLALSESSGFSRNAPYFHRHLSEAHFLLDDLASSATHAQAALAAIRTGGALALEPSCRLRLFHAALRTGDANGAWSELQTAARGAQAAQSPRVKVEVAAAYAQHCIRRGDLSQARTLLAIVIRHPAATRRQRKQAADTLATIGAPPAAPESADSAAVDAGLDHALELLLAAVRTP
ncbi:MAG: hypothetical protein IT518_02650 [Burkholderiales bacterium]|nr:hypothetical protein [Burkholderiales bacterium]